MKRSTHRKSGKGNGKAKFDLQKKLVFALQPPGTKKFSLSIPLSFTSGRPALTAGKRNLPASTKKQVLFQVSLEQN